MTLRHAGGCEHIHTHSNSEPLDSHTCHCSVCKRVTKQPSTHVVIFNHSDLVVDDLESLNRQPFNVENPDGPLELCTCSTCKMPIMLDDKEQRIRAIVPNIMGYDPESMPATYHAFFDPSAGAESPDDGRSIYAGMHPDFVMPESESVSTPQFDTEEATADAAEEAEEATADAAEETTETKACCVWLADAFRFL